jgi:hypothetical protein
LSGGDKPALSSSLSSDSSEQVSSEVPLIRDESAHKKQEQTLLCSVPLPLFSSFLDYSTTYFIAKYFAKKEEIR